MLDKDRISKEERIGICETLVRQNYLIEAYDLMKKYGITEIGAGRRLKLCTKMILQNLFDEERFLSWLALQVFEEENADSVILDYLCQYYNGPSEKMYRILMQGIEYRVDTYDMEERLLAQMLFSGEQDRMDGVFDLYASRKKMTDSIVKAYFAVKCTDYFYNETELDGRIFEYLEGLVKNTPEEAGTFPDGDPSYAAAGAEIAKQMHEYKSPFTLKKVCADRNTWLIGIGSALAFMAVMSYIASAIPTMIGYGYAPGFATGIFAVGGIMGIIGSFLFGVIDQKMGTKKAFLIYFVCIIIGFIFTLLMPRGAVFCWLAGIIIFAAQGALCNLLPSYVATKYGRWDYPSGYRVIGTVFEIGAGVGVMMIGIFQNAAVMYTFDIVTLVIGFIFMIASSDKFIGKAG